MKGKRRVSFLAIAGVALVMAAAVIVINRRSIFQEGNPLPVLAGIWRLEIRGEPYARIKDEPPTFIARAGRHDALFAAVEKAYGVTFRGASGDIYMFEGGGGKVRLAARNYARRYKIWEVMGGASP